MISDNIDIRDYYWGLKTKFKLEVGVENHVSKEYDDLIWFPMGVFITTSFNTQLSLNNRTISISGKDKMCMLNGEVGGQIFASVDFGTEEIAYTKIDKIDTSGERDSSFLNNADYYVEKTGNASTKTKKVRSIYTNDGYYYVELFDSYVPWDGNIESWMTYYKEKENEDGYEEVAEPDNYSGQLYIKEDGIVETPDRSTIITQIDPDRYETYEHFTKFYWKSSDNVYRLIEGTITAGYGSNEFNAISKVIPATYQYDGQLMFSEFAKKHGVYVMLARFTDPDEVFKVIEGTGAGILKYETNGQGKYYTLAEISESATIPEGRTFSTITNIYSRDQEFELKKLPLERIIRESVHAYALEPYHNIIINDLEDYALEQLTYIGDETLYAFRNVQEKNTNSGDISPGTNVFEQLALESMLDDATKNLFKSGIFEFDQLSELMQTGQEYNEHNSITTEVNGKEITYTVAKITYGMDVGYRITDLVYSGELISNIGEALTSVLDKIKTMLGDFEYFYDIEGRFVFQRQKTYVNTSWSQFVNNGDEKYVNYSLDNSDVAFSFEGNHLISQISKTPNLTNLKNDFVVWGKRKSSNGVEIPIHARYAIDKKPTSYTTLGGITYTSDEYDWRELIYQMALDYFGGQGCSLDKPYYDLTDPDDFLLAVAEKNPQYPRGYTGYEQYYTDMEGFWRQLYNPDYTPTARKNNDAGYVQKYLGTSGGFYTKYWQWEEATIDGYEFDYYPNNVANDLADGTAAVGETSEYTRYYTSEDAAAKRGWNTAVFEAPETLNFWIDFLDSGDELSQFQIPLIGDRQKVVKEDKASAIIFKEIPNLVMVDSSNPNEVSAAQEKTGFVPIFIPKGFVQYLQISYRSISVKDKIDELLYQYGYCSESVSITALPIYTLQPNTIIQVSDAATKIEGKYIVNKITLPLGYNKTMSINASKVPERLY